MLCSLCGGSTKDYFKDNEKEYLRCDTCSGVMLLPEYFIYPEEEKSRYLTHNNDVTDVRYQQFVHPITSEIVKSFDTSSRGLDFGCGTGPVAAVELQKSGFTVNLFDPFFENHPQALEQKYDFIICCEVMEHFHRPFNEF